VSGTLIFVTDYGLADGYAAELWAAAWSASPGVRCLDGTHLVPPGDVLTAAYRCKTLARTFGPGSVICAVVDPGVGGDRAAVAVECDGVACVAPDTGLVSYLWTESRERLAVRLPTPAGVSATFHGRDLFAPVAALITGGAPVDGLGEAVDSPRLRAELLPVVAGDVLRSVVVSVDHFGNCITGVRPTDLGDRGLASVGWPGGETAQVVSTYAEIDAEVAVLWNSAAHLELAARNASAAARTGVRVGTAITVALR
jgi:S-adenosylmethionine hydrolase